MEHDVSWLDRLASSHEPTGALTAARGPEGMSDRTGAARRLKRTLSEWCRDKLNAAADRVLNPRAANLRQRS